jgi:bla regulator protein blaR1
MITYILKTIACSALLIGIYFLILQKEKIYFFNRCYLLFSILFSFIVPAIVLNTKIPVSIIPLTINETTFSLERNISEKLIPVSPNGNLLSDLLLVGYLVVTAFLLCRFLVNTYFISARIRNSGKLMFMGSKIILTGENTAPHSFMNFIFVTGKDYENGIIEKEILTHELAHVRQKHSLDILLVEILTIVGWINPLLFLYKRAIQLNHEFLADAFVTKSFKDIRSYQLLLLGKVTQPLKMTFASPLNYFNIKKRIIMMSKNVSFKSAILKQVALIPVFAIFVFLFATKTIAQDQTKPAIQTPSTQQGVTGEVLNEYQAIIDKYKKTRPDGAFGYRLNLSAEDKEKLESIFFRMSKEQQDSQMFVFIPKSSMVLKRTSPTKEQLDSYKDPKIYGVWIDGSRVDNSILGNYKNTDFAYVFESILMKNATNYGKHVYQVNLMTNDYYQNYYNKQISDKGYAFMVRSIKKSSK